MTADITAARASAQSESAGQLRRERDKALAEVILLRTEAENADARYQSMRAVADQAITELGRAEAACERARATAVRFEQEIAHMLDTSDEAITRLAAVYHRAGLASWSSDDVPSYKRAGIRAVLAALGES